MHLVSVTGVVRDRRPRRSRGATLIATVLLSIVAASIVFVLVRQVLLSSRADSQRSTAAQAEAAALDAQELFEERLAADPTFFLRETWVYERARRCVTDAAGVVQPGQAWPAACGGQWAYERPADVASFEGDDDVEVRAEILPPSPEDPRLRLRILARIATVETGRFAAYQLDSADRFTVFSDRTLNLSDLSRGETAPAEASTTLDGAAYTGGQMLLPGDDSVTIRSAQLLAEDGFAFAGSDGAGGFVWAPEGATNRFYAAEPVSATEPPIRDVRKIVPVPLSTGGLRSSLSRTIDVACRFDDTGTATTPALLALDTNADGNLDAADADRASTFCLYAGAELVAADGSLVPVPPSGAYLLTFAEHGPGTVTVYTAPEEPAVAGECAIRCSLVELATPEVAAGTHPGARSFWGAPLGTFPLPANGVIATDAQTHVGLCGDAFLAEAVPGSNDCETISGSEPGMAIAAATTVVAGSVRSPADLVVSGPVHASAPVALVATDSVLLPFWARPWGPEGSLEVDSSLVALGVGRAAGDVDRPIRTLPARVARPLPGDRNTAGSLVITGSLAASRVDVSFTQYSSVALTASPALAELPPPFAPSFASVWSAAATAELRPHAVCGAATCNDF